jgi:drug/metabolite transporter (DMT)-like permease
MLLENIAPLVALFGSAWLFRERITRQALAALALALGGVILICLADPGLPAAARPASALGNGLALLAGLTWGGYTLACQGQSRDGHGARDALSAMAVMLVGSAVVLAPVALCMTGGWPSTAAAWGWVVALGLLHTAVATVLWRLALTHLSSYRASLLFLLTIVLTMSNGALFLGERPTPLMVLGACGIIGALLIPQPRRSGA